MYKIHRAEFGELSKPDPRNTLVACSTDNGLLSSTISVFSSTWKFWLFAISPKIFTYKGDCSLSSNNILRHQLDISGESSALGITYT